MIVDRLAAVGDVLVQRDEVAVIGDWAGRDLAIDVKATFKAARYKHVSVLDDQSATELVRSAEWQGSLLFAPDAVARILALAAGPPYFTQLFCQLLWNATPADKPMASPGSALPVDTSGAEPPKVTVAEVEAAIPSVLEAGENVCAWIWDGLPPAESVIFAAIAALTTEKTGKPDHRNAADLLALAVERQRAGRLWWTRHRWRIGHVLGAAVACTLLGGGGSALLRNEPPVHPYHTGPVTTPPPTGTAADLGVPRDAAGVVDQARLADQNAATAKPRPQPLPNGARSGGW